MNLEKTSFIGLLILVTLAFFALLADFAQPVFWAATLAVIFHPVYTACLSRVRGRKSVAALITLVVICVTVIIPLWFILSAVVDEAALLYAQIQSGELNIEQPLDWMRANLPAVTEILNKAGISVEEIWGNIGGRSRLFNQPIVDFIIGHGVVV